MNEYKEIENALNKAEESVVPFPIVDGETVAVVGDANQTQKNAHDFEIKFRIPQKTDDGIKYITKTVEYKDVFITPRQNQNILKAITAVLPYFKKPLVDGNIADYTDEEKKAIFESFEDELYGEMYNVVGAVLKIDPDLRDYMLPTSVFNAFANIIYQYPEMVNEADTFFE